MRLDRLEGPACPKCGCTESTIVRKGKNWNGREFVKRRCEHCNREYRVDDLIEEKPPQQAQSEDSDDQTACIVYQVNRCPYCQSTRIRVTTTRYTFRRHKCLDCKKTFKSIEKSH